MKCLSVRQPFAHLLVTGRKRIENRTWKTDYRGPLLIHASQTVEKEACERLGLDPDELTTGAIVGRVTLVNVFRYKDEDHYTEHGDEHHGTSYEDGKNGWVVADPIKFKEPIPLKGQLGLYEVGSLFTE